MSLHKFRTLLDDIKGKKINIPDFWDGFNLLSANGLFETNDSDFYRKVIDEIINEGDYSKSLSHIKGKTSNGDWVKEAVAYSIMIRTSTTWDLDNDGLISDDETGSFLRTIFLLPTLKKMGVSMLYLLPISKYSLKDKKGELGSVYGVSNFFKFDESLGDYIVDGLMSLEEQFQALVEAAHMLDMRVVIDIIPRTNSVNSDLIREHPDWFYWIKYKDLKDYSPPRVLGIGEGIQPSEDNLETVYKSEDVKKHINLFQKDPRSLDSEKWNKVKDNNGEILDIVRKEFGLTVAPAFSDHINDPQPPWSDVTFFRLYWDHPIESEKYHNKDYNPYILFDSIKGNLFPGKLVNNELWSLLSDVIPYYQQFGIDGARIDMGHALPKELTQLIIKKAKQIDSDFAFIAEEMNIDNAKIQKKLGYNMIIGNGFWMTPRLKDKRTHEFYRKISKLATPVFACGETHDTQRLVARDDGGKKLSKMVTVLNMFAANGVPFINSGQELFEIQPMNLGIDCRPGEDKNLSKDDPFYGKLALFDKYQFHYLGDDRWELVNLLEEINEVKDKYLKHIIKNKPLKNQLGFEIKVNNGYLYIIANDNLKEEVNINFKKDATVLVSSEQNRNDYYLPGEVKILFSKKKNAIIKDRD